MRTHHSYISDHCVSHHPGQPLRSVRAGTSLRRICGVFLFLILWGAIALGIGPAAAWAEDYNKEILLGADFSGQVLTDSSFTKANLRGSNFSQSDLQGVSFFGANLEKANLQGANLSYATLDTARFAGANLTNAVLEGAFAFNANFDGAIIDGADFTDVLLRGDVQEKLCRSAAGVNPTTGRATRETLDCD
jgi:uncharacterized protein YjbI with pentapeptide repeats